MSASGGNGKAHEPIDEEALDWALRMAEPDADWEAFTDWLEADPDRSTRYDRAAIALDQAAAAMPRPAPTPTVVEDRPALSRPVAPARRRWLSGAIAAVLVGGVGLGAWSQRDQSYTVLTAPGEQRTVALADGSSIVLAGGSRVRLDGADPRIAAVEAGEVLFNVRHDDSAPFRVRAGGLSLVDLGTVFDVRLAGSRTRVAVAEGAVMVRGGGAEVRLDPGQAVVADGRSLQRERQDVALVGSWREGLLSFNDATMREVAEALSRNLGPRITAAPAIEGQVFNGTVELRTLRADPALIGELLGVEARRDANGWTLDRRR
jgi:transmembrane sensor